MIKHITHMNLFLTYEHRQQTFPLLTYVRVTNLNDLSSTYEHSVLSMRQQYQREFHIVVNQKLRTPK